MPRAENIRPLFTMEAKKAPTFRSVLKIYCFKNELVILFSSAICVTGEYAYSHNRKK